MEKKKYTKEAEAFATHKVGPQGERLGMDNWYEWDTIAHSFQAGQKVPAWRDPNESQPPVGEEVLVLMDRFPHQPTPYIQTWNGPSKHILGWMSIPKHRRVL
jgi:hypothetical protein